SVLIGLAGLFGIIYVLRILFFTARLQEYVPDLEDWVWYTVCPFFAYVATFAGAIALLHAMSSGALFAIAAAVVALIFIGIRNAWDTSTYIAIHGMPGSPE
ncbi:MAG: hypothetical protein JO293_05035, partial [Candidatus Eremiobacteraeota bacterium]|nr:hypothetical protein [Candidatus Eremiobacteraeota bacterium]